jgi:hypothetical protein
MTQVAQTILSQLGGNRFIAMTGAKNFVGGNDDLRFFLPRAAKNGVNRFWVRLDADDTYTVEGGKWNAKRLEVVRVKRAEGIYASNLRDVFTVITGLETSL